MSYQDGLHTGLTNAEYQSLPALSYSGLKQFAETPAHYQAYLRSVREETASQRLGTLVHMGVLEPERFAKSIAVIEGNRNSNAVKQAVAEAEASGLYVCKPDEFEQASRMVKSVRETPEIRDIFSRPGGVAESSILWTEPETGVRKKCRPDYYVQGEGIVVDLKYFSDLNDKAIEKQIFRMKYAWQSAHYLEGVSLLEGRHRTQFIHCFVMDRDPFLTRVVMLEDPALEKADMVIRELTAKYAWCVKNNQWPGYAPGIVTVTYPDYAW